MMHFLIALAGILIVTGPAWSKCDTGAVVYSNSTSYGLNLGGGNSSSEFGTNTTINIPLVVDGKGACYRQKNALSVKTERVDANEFVEFIVQPLEAEFENVPKPMTYQYLNIEYDSKRQASKVYMMSFLCSGETPIGGDAYSNSLTKLMGSGKETGVTINMVIATGSAADHLSGKKENKSQSKIFDHFIELYEDHSGDNLSIDDDQTNIYVPNVVTGLSISAVSPSEKKLYSHFFKTTNSSINGCSKKFISKMQGYLIDNVAKNKPFKDIEMKRKRFSSAYKMKWTL